MQNDAEKQKAEKAIGTGLGVGVVAGTFGGMCVSQLFNAASLSSTTVFFLSTSVLANVALAAFSFYVAFKAWRSTASQKPQLPPALPPAPQPE